MVSVGRTENFLTMFSFPEGAEDSHKRASVPPRRATGASWLRTTLVSAGHRFADFGGVDELFEADDSAAADDEVVGDAHVHVSAGRLVGGGVAGEDDDVLAVDDVSVVVGDPAVP